MIFWYIGIPLAIILWVIFALTYSKIIFKNFSNSFCLSMVDEPEDFIYASLLIVCVGLGWPITIPFGVVCYIIYLIYLIWRFLTSLRNRGIQ